MTVLVSAPYKAYPTLMAMVMSFILLFSCAFARASCKPPSATKIEEVEKYLLTLRNLPDKSLDLVQSLQSDNSCIWKIQFEEKSNANILTAFLSPDRKFIAADLHSLRVDPVLETRQRNLRLMTMLVNGDSLTFGAINPTITIVEFADFECPYCAHEAKILREIVEQDKSVRVVFRNYPIPRHIWAMDAAESSECIAAQSVSEFWKVYNYLFLDQLKLSESNISSEISGFVARSNDIDFDRFTKCVKAGEMVNAVSEDMKLGRLNGVHATPTLFINGVKYEGLKDSDQLRAILDATRQGSVWPVTAKRPSEVTR
jgi:protein-disulfide isomerase